MSKPATPIVLTDEERAALERMVRGAKTERRMVTRAQIILAAAEGQATTHIAARMGLTPATVSKWRTRFASDRLDGLRDAPRSGQPVRYGAAAEKRILALLDQPPPSGYATWNGRLLAEALGDVPEHQVYAVLRKHGIQLQRRRSWCISTDPEFAAKAADIVGLYLDPPENALVLSVDEKPHIQALERSQGYLRLPSGRAVTGFAHEYKRNGTTTLFAALNVATGQVQAGHYQRRRRVDFLDFMEQLLAEYPDQDIHVILDNLNIHKSKRDGWLERNPRVHFHYTPTHASWLNQIEVWFSILSRSALKGASFNSVAELREAIDRFIQAYNPTAAPFQWQRKTVRQAPLERSYANLLN
ncbi:MAG: IS630 family transposase [Desulfuromonadales bacterium]|nr:IS630 family transposase [Desulfuromonadales bacterium]NIT64765.1 IS630 family transposase [Gammaproteobacteria bacterium]NIV21736.1 IS630 family transposase [Gammaproteobacteria bacterium]NIY33345.1 IS630 family transposase [Gammaproteobacteria bacterium]